jgi:hypothetical protein
MKTTINYLFNKNYSYLQSIHAKQIELNKIASVRQGVFLSNRTSKTMSDLGENLGVVIFGPNNKFIARTSTFYDNNVKLLKEFISKKIDELRQLDKCSEKDIKPLIFGGLSYDSNSKLAEESCKLVDVLEESCKLENVEPTIITGSYAPVEDAGFNSHISDKYISFWGELIDKLKFSNNPTQSDMKQTLEEVFEYVKIPENTTITVNNKKINP